LKKTLLLAVLLLGSPVLSALAADSAAPDLALTDLLQAPDGAKIDWPSLKGKVVLVNFWATWCVPCVAEFPLLNELMTSADPAKIQLIAVDYNGESNDEISAFLKKHPLSAWVGIDAARETQKRYGVRAIPATFIVGPDGKIVQRTEHPETLTVQQLTDLADGKPVSFDGLVKASNALLDEQKKAAAEAEKVKIASFMATNGKILATAPGIILAEAASVPDDGMPAELTRTAMWEKGRFNLLDGRIEDLAAHLKKIEATRVVLSGFTSNKRYNLHVDRAGMNPKALDSAIEQVLARGLGLKIERKTLDHDALILSAGPEATNHLDGPDAKPEQRYCFFNPTPPDKGVVCAGGSFDQLADALEDATETPVFNKTKLAGHLTATLSLPLDLTSLGLTLKPVKRRIEMVVVMRK
jgi:thiol-disulfide isomerase/thioredoxin